MKQISAYISDESKLLLENFSKHSGLKKGFIIEQAIVQYINTQQNLPNDIIVPPSVRVSKKVFDEIIMSDNEPSNSLKKLLLDEN